jgi:A/G-specific adenine glycosylase
MAAIAAANGAPTARCLSTFAKRLVAWQRTHGRHDLPWQNTRDPYRIWLSEIMLQQTQVSTVIGYFNRFVGEFPGVEQLAAAPLERVLELWSGLGYYRRAHHLHDAAKVVATSHRGIFPLDIDAIAALPGIGRSTAAAIATFAYGIRAPILDGNVKRVIARHRGIEGFPGAPKVADELWRHAQRLLPQHDVVSYTQGLMDLGATLCTRRKPRCGECPVALDCIARNTLRVDALPTPRPKKRLPQRSIRVLVIERAREILFEKRPAVGIWGGLWSLPEMACNDDITTHCRARFDARVVVGAEIPAIEHGFSHYRLTLYPRKVSVSQWPSRAEAPGLVWLTRDDALNAALPAPIKKLVRSL